MSANVSPKQALFIQCLLAGHTIVSSSKIAGIAEKTGHQWLKLPHVQEAYKAAQKQLFDSALDMLSLNLKDALEALQRHIKPTIEPTAATQVSAARIWLEQSIAIHKVSELEQKVQELEHMLKGGE
jgi:phage terminase small subunit